MWQDCISSTYRSFFFDKNKVDCCIIDSLLEWVNSVNMAVSKNRGTPKWMVYNGKLIKMDDLGVPLFLETPKQLKKLPGPNMEWPNHLPDRPVQPPVTSDASRVTVTGGA